ncbi:hypothetical protein BDD12DRAFT_908434 [Trichophaea hybrida]|nr:hypothetical protein BDD12DRAFT_908434 [Trichophaea hybrida]
MSTNITFDNYVRSLAASFALAINGQFVGRKQLPKVVEGGDTGTFSKQQTLERLGVLLKAGLACELNERVKLGTLQDVTIYPGHKERLREMEKRVKEEKLKNAPKEDKVVTIMGNIFATTAAVAVAATPTTTGVSTAAACVAACVAATRTTTTTAPTTTADASSPPSAPTAPTSSPTPSSTPPPPSAPLLPYTLQHNILPPLQSFLELSCYNYLSKHNPHLLLSKSWAIPQSAELHTYTREIPAFRNNPSLLKSITEIRHVAVHRIPVTEAKIYELLDAAEVGAGVLGDTAAALKMKELRGVVETWFDKRKGGEEEEVRDRERLEFLEKRKRELEEEMGRLKKKLERRGKEVRKVVRGLKIDVEGLLSPRDDGSESES